MSDEPTIHTDSPADERIHRPWLILAVGSWLVLSLGHGTGLDIVSLLVEWIRLPGSVSEQGGQAGFLQGERILAGTLGLCGIICLIFVTRRAAPFGAIAVGRLVPAWILCAALGWLSWKLIIIYTTELVHFAQYALIGALLSIALGKGRRPQLAFVMTFFLGMMDEVWQHYGLHVWRLQEQTHYLDWSDPFLNGVGAFAGVLPAACWLRLRESGSSQMRVIFAAAGMAVVLLFPLLWLDPATLSSWFGSYSYYPFWDEHTNLKPVHWVTPYEGIPLIPAFLLIVGSVLDPVRPSPSVMVLTLSIICVGMAIHPPSRLAGTPVHEPVPTAAVIPVLEGAIDIDGIADEARWRDAARLGPFVDNLSGLLSSPECADANLPQTHARILWSAEALYLLLDVSDEDIWARDLARDDGGVLGDEGLRLLIDDGGEEVLFYEIDLSPANTVTDLLQIVAGAPVDFNPDSPTLGWQQFDAPQIGSAVHIDGSLEWVSSSQEPVTTSADHGYTAELRIPWSVFRTTSTPSGNSARFALPPRVGQRWRLGLYRVETPRPTAPLAQWLSADEAQGQLGVDPKQWDMLLKERNWSLDAQGRIAGPTVWWELIRRCGRTQAWSPTYRDIRQPSHFGVIEFVEG